MNFRSRQFNYLVKPFIFTVWHSPRTFPGDVLMTYLLEYVLFSFKQRRIFDDDDKGGCLVIVCISYQILKTSRGIHILFGETLYSAHANLVHTNYRNTYRQYYCDLKHDSFIFFFYCTVNGDVLKLNVLRTNPYISIPKPFL